MTREDAGSDGGDSDPAGSNDDGERTEGPRTGTAGPGRDGDATGAGTGARPGADANDEATDGEPASDALPRDVVEEAERLTRLARRAVDPGEAEACERRRDDLLSEYGFEARVRAADDTLVCYPAEWLVDGVVRLERVEDTDRAAEVSLSGPGDEDEYDAIEAHNAALVARVAEAAGPVHAANARAFADFLGNHYLKRVEDATPAELREFVEEYYVRNAWPSAEQRAVLDESLAVLYEAADAPLPDGDS
jgi:hypothetical protein